MASKTTIYNLAISHLGTGKTVQDYTEPSAEAVICTRFYDITLEEVLRDFHWPFARRVAALSLIEEDPTDEWGYSYGYPSDCAKFRRILSGVRNDTRQSKVPFVITHGSTQRAIFCDVEDAVGEWTKKVTDVGRFPADFMMALSLRLAYYVSPALTKGDPFKLGEKALLKYNMEIQAAQANSLGEEQDEEEPDSLFVRERS